MFNWEDEPKKFSFTAPVIDFLNGAVTIVNKSMVTKTVPNHELGKYNSVLSI